ncbi:unnamed protein product, partial [marine sediment metagenome]
MDTIGSHLQLNAVTITNQIAYFVLPFLQYKIDIQEFQINEDLQVYQFIS